MKYLFWRENTNNPWLTMVLFIYSFSFWRYGGAKVIGIQWASCLKLGPELTVPGPAPWRRQILPPLAAMILCSSSCSRDVWGSPHPYLLSLYRSCLGDHRVKISWVQHTTSQLPAYSSYGSYSISTPSSSVFHSVRLSCRDISWVWTHSCSWLFDQ